MALLLTTVGVIPNNKGYGLNLTETLVSQHLKSVGYATHAVGKWHLGLFEYEYTPTYRGYDSFYGYSAHVSLEPHAPLPGTMVEVKTILSTEILALTCTWMLERNVAQTARWYEAFHLTTCLLLEHRQC